LWQELQVKRRLIVAPPSFVIKVVDKDGIRTIKTIRPIT
jgi:20S proteasome subunit beta 4